MVVLFEAAPQVTVIGHVPGVVREPTSQVQLTLPAPSDVAGLKPAAVDGPVLYITTMKQPVLGDVRAASVAVWPCATVSGALRNVTVAAGGGGGGGAVGVTVGAEVGAAVGAAVAVGVEVGGAAPTVL